MERLNYYAADNGDDKDTVDLEQEELETAANRGGTEDEDEEEEPEEEDKFANASDGQLLYELLKKKDLVTDGNWFELTLALRTKWDGVAEDLVVSDIRSEIIEEITEK